jgi:type II secretory pathway component PulJ
MVNVTHVLLALIIFSILLAVGFAILAGIIPGFNEFTEQFRCGLGLAKCA